MVFEYLHHFPSSLPTNDKYQTEFFEITSCCYLEKYINFTDVTIGFNPDIITKLALESKIHEMEEKDRHVIIAFDEMQIKSNLVYHRGTGQLIGFSEMGDINEEFSYLQRTSAAGENEECDFTSRELATHVTLYMVRGICSSLLYPFGYFASAGMTSSQLYFTTMEAIRVLTAINFKVCIL